MDCVVGGVYFIKDAYFSEFPDPYLKQNKGEKRPFYYCFSDQNGILWMIPLSSRPNKIALARQKAAQGKTDIFHETDIGGVAGVMLIGDMFPVTADYISAPYTINDNPYRFIDQSELALIRRKATKVLRLLRKGTKFSPTQPNVLAIEKALLNRKICS